MLTVHPGARQIVFGDMINAAATPSTEVVADTMRDAIMTLLYLAAIATFTFSTSFLCTMTAAGRTVTRVRNEYMNGIIRLTMKEFDEITPAVVSNHLDDVANEMYSGLAAKFVEGIQGTSMMIAGFAVAFYFSWKMTLVILAGVPFLGIATYFMIKSMGGNDAFMGKEAYQKAGSIASETLSAMRTIASLGAEVPSAQRYEDNLKTAEIAAIKQGTEKSFFAGALWGIMFALYGLGFWYGGVLVIQSTDDAIKTYPPPNELIDAVTNVTFNYTGTYADHVPYVQEVCSEYQDQALNVCACAIPWTDLDLADLNCGCMHGSEGSFDKTECFRGGDAVLVFFSVLIGGFALGQIGPAFEKITKARVAAASLYDAIDRTLLRHQQEANRAKKKTIVGQEAKPNVRGAITFKGVTFKYASREHPLFTGLDLNIEGGQTVALVGESGCGKSTLGRLLLRLYDVDQGHITLDGVDLTDLDTASLRRHIGVVSQEPLLFEGTIADNIRYGRWGEDVPMRDVVAAAEAANCDFIAGFPDKFETQVGAKGAKLSGGQKQRIAIARALIRDPPILLLDEATSALDSRSERIVQKALDGLIAGKGKKRTIIVIAHRLSTIRNADKIVVLGNPEGTSTARGSFVLETGTHDELISKANGFYNALVSKAQMGTSRSTSEESSKQNEKDGVIDLSIPGSPRHHRAGSSDVVDDTPTPKAMEALEIDVADDGASSNASEDGWWTKMTSCCKKEGDDEKEKDVPSSRVWAYSTPERPYLALGLLASFLNGLIWPAVAIAFTEILTILYDFDTDEIEYQVYKWGVIFLCIGASSWILNTLQGLAFSIVSERLTTRLRTDVFRAMTRQDISYFDDPDHGVGALQSVLSTDTNYLHYTTGSALGGHVFTLSNIGGGFAIALYASWKFSLGLLAVMPVFGVAGAMEVVLFTNSEGNIRDVMGPALSFVNEAVAGIREVKAFGLERRVTEIVRESLRGTIESEMKKQAFVQGGAQGAVQCVTLCFYAFAFWLGAKLIEDGELTFKNLNMALWGLALSATGMGTATSFFGDQGKANAAKKRIFTLIDRVPSIDSKPWNTDTACPRSSIAPSALKTCRGEIEMRHVRFAYPTRQNAPIFNDISLKIRSEQTIAFVGSSGCGKSTAIQLFERFYDPIASSSKENVGRILLDGIDIREMDVKWLRQQMSMVGQEPKLFNMSVYDNIALGKPGASRDDIVRAAKAAHCHSFVMNLEDQYDTNVGERGSKLSGGQKQRVAIARAILKEPKILLLDEATSALDNESEKIVQDSLNAIAKTSSCTTIIVAHKLSTIVDADCIFVFENDGDGAVVVERGTHRELIELDGKYKALYDAFNNK